MTRKVPLSSTFSPVLEGSKVDDDAVLPRIVSPCHLDKIDIDGGHDDQQHQEEEGECLAAPLVSVMPDISIASTSASDVIGDMSGGGNGGGNDDSGSGSLSSLSLTCLQCRVCRREMPDDITATMCGHVFCNR